MKKTLLLMLLITLTTYSQRIITTSTLRIKHGDMTLHLTKDTCTLASKHKLKYSNFLRLDNKRDDKWFIDTYKGKYSRKPYRYSGYDSGHLTPAHITSYDDILNHNSFSLFNQAPQLHLFNKGKWFKLECHIENMIAENKKNAIIIKGIIYR